MKPSDAIREIKKFVTMCRKVAEKRRDRISHTFFQHIHIGDIGIMAYFEHSNYCSEAFRKELIVSIYNGKDSNITYKDFKYDLNYAVVEYKIILKEIKEVLNGLEKEIIR